MNKCIPQCKNARKGEFFYGTEKCWFQQNETENQENNENQNQENNQTKNQENHQTHNQEITSKLFNMMEIFSERMI